jgi:hypothetical protein
LQIHLVGAWCDHGFACFVLYCIVAARLTGYAWRFAAVGHINDSTNKKMHPSCRSGVS